MKTLKKFFLIMILIAISYTGFSQSTPSGHLRVATMTTTFGVNVPVGTTVYCAADSTFWTVTHPLLGTLTLTTAQGWVDKVNKPTNLAQGTKTATTVQITSSTGTAATLDTADATHAGVMSASDKNRLLKVTGTNTGDQKLTVDGSTTHATMTIGGAASDTVCVVGAGINKVSVSGKTVTVTGTEVDGSISNEGALTVDAGAANTVKIHSNTSTSTDLTITAGTGITIDGESANGFTINSTVSNHIFITEFFDEATTGATGTAHTLAHTPVTASTGMVVQLNGTPLKSNQFTNSTTTLTVTIPVYKYDRVSVSYTY